MLNVMEILLYIILIFVVAFVAYKIGKYFGSKVTGEEIKAQREDAIKRSRAVLTGQFSEQLAPYLPDFSFSPSECRFIGKPIDLVAFVGSDDRHITEVVFIEVKSGSSQLSSVERTLRNAIQEKKVRWVEYRVP